MVQMKGLIVCNLASLHCLLYIPHGSDERGQKERLYNLHRFFISHMVQMKVIKI